jgi:hypothetical protein
VFERDHDEPAVRRVTTSARRIVGADAEAPRRPPQCDHRGERAGIRHGAVAHLSPRSVEEIDGDAESDAELRGVFERTRTIAVLGAKAQPEEAWNVPRYPSAWLLRARSQPEARALG